MGFEEKPEKNMMRNKKGRTETEARKVEVMLFWKRKSTIFMLFYLIPGTVKSSKVFALLLILPSLSKLNQSKNYNFFPK